MIDLDLAHITEIGMMTKAQRHTPKEGMAADSLPRYKLFFAYVSGVQLFSRHRDYLAPRENKQEFQVPELTLFHQVLSQANDHRPWSELLCQLAQ